MFQIRWLWKNMDKRYHVQYIAAHHSVRRDQRHDADQLYLTGRLFDDVIVAQNPDPLLSILLAMLVFQVLRQGMLYTMIMLLEWSSQNLLYNLRLHLFRNLQYQEMSFFQPQPHRGPDDAPVRRSGLVPPFHRLSGVPNRGTVW